MLLLRAYVSHLRSVLAGLRLASDNKDVFVGILGELIVEYIGMPAVTFAPLASTRNLAGLLRNFIRTRHGQITALITRALQADALVVTVRDGIRTEAYDRFVKNNAFVIHLKKRKLKCAHAPLLKRAHYVTIEPRYAQIVLIVLTRTDTEHDWTVDESQEYFGPREWMLTEMRQTLRRTLKAVQTILSNGAKDGLIIGCVKKIRKAQRRIAVAHVMAFSLVGGSASDQLGALNLSGVEAPAPGFIGVHER
ncbi:hypothetical protein TI39_contig4137g00001 [Zymoseptoria brevis]|uniref:Uncharacterized protein n=1 Tax=Zymoseptoria brevis TaxID=1047168 RepID=A0A0F4GCI6_9PEZI|nr:hypothetical protein TI39_contig4137g00001 [Zymoseptoria brevis]